MKKISLLLASTGLYLLSYSQVWVEKDSLPISSSVQSPFSFSINGKLYVGGGYNGTTTDGFYEYDPVTNTWTTLANLPTPIESSYGFVLNGMGYMVGGWNGSSLSNSVNMYNPGTNTWTPKNAFPGAARQNHVCVSANGCGYLFGGFTGGSNVVNDMWQYNDSTDSWLQMASAPGPGRDNPTGLSINNHIYVGMGSTSSGSPSFSDFYLFDPIGNTYTAMDSIPVGRSCAANFASGNLGYIGLGIIAEGSYLADFYSFNPSTHSWTQLDSFGGGPRKNPFNEVVTGVPYIGCGVNNASFLSDCWSYGFPTGMQSMTANDNTILSCYPSPTSEGFTISMRGYGTGERQIRICDQLGQVVYQTVSSQNKIQVGNKLVPGVYIVSVAQGAQYGYTKVVVTAD